VTGTAYYGYLSMGMMSSGLWLEYCVFGLVNLIIGASIGGAIYTEDAAA
jgi:hypothetical protein